MKARNTTPEMPDYFTPMSGEGAAHVRGSHGRTSHILQTPNTSYSRKRSRPEPSSNRSTNSFTTPYAHSEISMPWNDFPMADSSIARSTKTGSPPPMVNTKYILAGGLDTPLLAQSRQLDRDEYFSAQADVNFRSKWDGDIVKEIRDVAQSPPSSPSGSAAPGRGWGKFMFGIVGGVAGKVWQFCSSAAFKGFHAGGGQGYHLSPGNDADPDMNGDESHWEEDSGAIRRFERDATPVPGQYPSEDDDYLSSRPAKRLHTDTNTGWVVVEKAPAHHHPSPSPFSSTTAPPRRSRPSLTPISRRKPSATPLHARHPSTASIAPHRTPSPSSPRTRRSAQPSPTRPAHPRPSSAALRSPAATHVRASGTSRPTSRSGRASYAPPTFGHARSFSGDVTRAHELRLDVHRVGGGAGSEGGSPTNISPEARRYLREREYGEQRQEQRMRRMQRQMDEMLRQGKEALGSRVEVVYPDEMEGGYEGEMDVDFG